MHAFVLSLTLLHILAREQLLIQEKGWPDSMASWGATSCQRIEMLGISRPTLSIATRRMERRRPDSSGSIDASSAQAARSPLA